MKRSTLGLLGGLLVVAVIGTLWSKLFIASPVEEAGPSPVALGGSGPTADVPSPLDRSNPPLDVRTPLTNLLTVKDETGTPLPGATLVRSFADAEWMNAAAPWPDRDWADLDSRSAHAVTNGLGQVTLDQLVLPTPLADSIVWTTHTTHLGAHFSLLESAPQASPGSIILRSADPRLVIVKGPDGKPAVGATVTQVFDTAFIDKSVASLRGALRLFHFTTATDALGMGSLVPMEGNQLVFARLGELQSKPWHGPLPPTLELALLATCTISCHIVPAEAGDNPDGSAVMVSVLKGSAALELATFLVHGRQVAPTQCPVVLAPSLVFELRDPRYIPSQVTAKMPSPGGYLEVSITARRGLALPILVTDDANRPLPDTQVTVKWQMENQWNVAQLETDGQGLGNFRALPPGQMQLDFSHDGFKPVSLMDFFLTPAQVDPVHVLLSTGGRIEGKVTSAEGPVTTFFITHWGDNPAQAMCDVFEDSPDGTFALDALPTGDVHLFAESPELPRSAVSTVRVEAESTSVIAFSLEPGTTLRGRVVDGETFEPLSGAEVQLWTSLNSKSVRMFGSPARSGTDGSFSASGLARGENIATISSPGFPELLRSIPNSQFVDVDVGVVPLWKLDSITVALDIADGVNPSAYWLEVMVPDHIPIQPFTASKSVEISSPRPARYVIDGIFPDGSVYSINANVRPGEKHAYSIKARPTRNQVLEFVAESPEFDHAVVGCSMLFRINNETSVVFTRTVGPTSRIDVGNVPVDDFTLSAFDSTDRLLVNKAIRNASSLGPTIRVTVGDLLVYVLLVDERDAPVVGAYVGILDPRDSALPLSYAITDEEGRCSISRGDSDRATLKVFRDQESFEYFGKALLKSSPDHPLRLVFKADQTVRVSVRDLSFPMSGVEVRLAGAEDRLDYVRTQNTNDSGEAQFDRIGSAEYLLSCDQPGLWPTTLSVSSSKAPGETVMQVRRLGSVVLEPQREGLPVAGLGIQLWSIEFNTTVSEWSNMGRVSAAPATLRTDFSGKLRIDGLPHGEYRWQVLLPDGNAAEGSLTVQPSGVSSVILTLP